LRIISGILRMTLKNKSELKLIILMKKLTMLLLTGFTALTTLGQDITGSWYGVLKIQGTELRLVFNITKTTDGYSSTMDSPDQGANGIPVTSTVFADSKLKIELTNLRIEYTGELKENVITGTFRQSGLALPMDLSRNKIEKTVLIRPQEPVKPYPYYTEDVKFANPAADVVLAGTLTLPRKEGSFPVVVMITGSGPQNRDEELLGHKPFLVIADHLTRNGIAVLRYDDRGTAQSNGDFRTATSTDFASDAEAAISYLKTRKEINQKKIGLIGHSEGGIIAPMVAANSKDVAFIVLLAGTGIPGYRILLMQQELVARASGKSEGEIQKSKKINAEAFDIILKSDNTNDLSTELTRFLEDQLAKDPGAEIPAGMSQADFIKAQVDQMTTPWMLFFFKYDPAPTLEKVSCPVLAVNGSKDLQVPPKENLEAIEKALKKGGNKKVAAIEFDGLNHLFQECRTGSPDEYAKIEQTFSPGALDEITRWILKLVK